MKKVLYSAVLLLYGLFVNAQQEYQVSHNMFNSAAINPGAAGIDNAICAQLMGRQQWMGFDGAPNTYILNVNSNLGVFGMSENLGVGLTLFQDNIGAGYSTTAKLSANYQLPLTQGQGKLSFGLDLGMVAGGIDPMQLNPNDMADNTLQGIMSSNSRITGSTFTGGIGAFYKANNLYFGLSTSQLLESTTVYSSASVQMKRHYYITGGYETKAVMNGQLKFKPSIFIKTDGATTTMDLSVLAEYNNALWTGFSYRTEDAVVALVGMNINKMKVGLAYDFTTSDIRTTSSSGSVELFMRYCHTIELKAKTKEFVDPSLLQ